MDNNITKIKFVENSIYELSKQIFQIQSTKKLKDYNVDTDLSK